MVVCYFRTTTQYEGYICAIENCTNRRDDRLSQSYPNAYTQQKKAASSKLAAFKYNKVKITSTIQPTFP